LRFRFATQAFLLLVLAFVPAIGQAVYFRGKVPWQSRVATSDTVEVAVARNWGPSVIWVDARPDAEFAAGHIPGAIQLNEDRWNELVPVFTSSWTPDKKVVVYCSAQSCNLAGDVARRLREEEQLKDSEGKNCVFVLSGGWEEWQRRTAGRGEK
jgi:rhodanese-related sulfurtransferase